MKICQSNEWSSHDAVHRAESECSGDEQTGLVILKRALEARTRQIVENSNFDGGGRAPFPIRYFYERRLGQQQHASDSILERRSDHGMSMG